MRVLAGDIGGTKTWLRIADFSTGSNRGRVLYERRYESHSYPSLIPMLHEFLISAGGGAAPSLNKACFGVAGPITQAIAGQIVRVTNLPWEIDSMSLAREVGIERVRLINDFQAIGYGIEALADKDLAVLQDGQPRPDAPRAVIGPGTGLGVALMIRQNDHYEVLSSEGGHADFAPADALQVQLLLYLMERFGHVSYERILSGPGLVHSYDFLREQHPEQASADLVHAMEIADPAAAITEFALAGKDALATQAVDLFITVCGAYAGNLALIALAYGGVYVAGGIAPKIIERFKSGAFLRAFTNKGRMSPLTGAMPVRVVLNPQVGLLGAALAASRL